MSDIPGAKHKTSVNKTLHCERTQHILKRIIAGYTQAEIAQELGISRSRVAELAIQAREEWSAENRRTAEEWIEIIRQRYEVACKAIWPLVEVGDAAAIDRLVKLTIETRKMLGLDKAVKLEISGEVEANAADFDRRINQILAARAADPALGPKDDEEPEEATDAPGS